MRKQFLVMVSNSRSWKFLQTPITRAQLKQWWEQFTDLFDNTPPYEPREVPEPEPLPSRKVAVGDTAINPKWNWITVKNPKGRPNGNGFSDFGDTAGIKEGGVLTVIAVDGGQVLVSYESPRGQGYGSEAGNGTLFFVSAAEFLSMTPRYQQIQANRTSEKERIMNLLRSSLAAETSGASE